MSEQQTAHDAQIQSLLNDRAVSAQEAEIHNQHDSAQIKELTTQNQRLRLLCSENTRELLQAKKDMMIWERKLVEEKNQLVDQLNDTKKNLVIQEDRAIDAEKIVEVRIVKKHESLVTELRNLLGKTQQSAHILQTKYDKLESQHLKKQKQLQQKIDLVTQSYIALRKRRDFEIEGFTSEVQLLRRSIKELEKCILKFGPLEDRELILLDIAQRTGLKADKLSSSLVNLKGKVQDLQEQVATVKI